MNSSFSFVTDIRSIVKNNIEQNQPANKRNRQKKMRERVVVKTPILLREKGPISQVAAYCFSKCAKLEKTNKIPYWQAPGNKTQEPHNNGLIFGERCRHRAHTWSCFVPDKRHYHRCQRDHRTGTPIEYLRSHFIISLKVTVIRHSFGPTYSIASCWLASGLKLTVLRFPHCLAEVITARKCRRTNATCKPPSVLYGQINAFSQLVYRTCFNNIIFQLHLLKWIRLLVLQQGHIIVERGAFYNLFHDIVQGHLFTEGAKTEKEGK